MAATVEALPAWDVDALREAVSEAVLEPRLRSVVRRADDLAGTHRGRLASLGEADFAIFLDSYQCCVQELQRATSYAELAMASDLLDSEATAALARCDLAWSALATALSFVEPELAAMTADQAARHRLLAPGGSLHNFHQRVLATPAQDETVARVLNALRPSGVDGWQTLARQLLSRITVATPAGAAGVGSTMPTLYQPDRSLRRQAHRAITDALAA